MKHRLNKRLRFLEFVPPDESWDYIPRRFAESIGAEIVFPKHFFPTTDGEPFCLTLRKGGNEFPIVVETLAEVSVSKGINRILFFFNKTEWKKLLSIIAIP